MATLLAISLNPNVSISDIPTIIRGLIRPQKDAVAQFENIFECYHGESYVAKSFYTGRGAWYTILRALQVGEGDEVLVPAFTCVAVVNPIRWVGAKPVFVDITDEYVMDLYDAASKVTQSTKVLLAQHTFGHVVDIEQYALLAAKYGLALIEDCAHALGSRFDDGSPVGTKSTAAFFSFGRDKCITALSGGMALTKDNNLAQAIEEIRKTFRSPTFMQRVQDVVYVLFIEKMYVLYYVSSILGKMYHRVLLTSGLIKRANSEDEKRGLPEASVLRRWHGMYAHLAKRQFMRLQEFTQHRRRVASMYTKELSKEGLNIPSDQKQRTYLRYPVLVDDPKSVRISAQSHDVILGDWYDKVVGPSTVDLTAVGYKMGSCPHAERITQKVINLPTSPRLSSNDIQRLVGLLSQLPITNNQETAKP